ncbi:MAG: magnesium/cobalt transporter CorA [Bacteroidales bacterium]
MARFIKRRSFSKGTKPGSLILIGKQQTEQVIIRVMQYDRNGLVEKETETIDEALSMINENELTWINIYGIHDPEVISTLGERLNVDSLILEDIMNTDHRPKYSEDDQKLYFISKLLSLNKETNRIEADQLSIIAGENYVVSLQEKPGKHFDDVRERIRKSKDRSRINHPDYLAYALLDCMVDTYLDLIVEIGNAIDALETEILEHRERQTSQKIYMHRTELNFLRQIVLPLKELTFFFLKSESDIIRDETRSFIEDLNDHVVITHERLEVYYSLVADQMEIYNAIISNRSNEIMKVLTVFAAFFIPLTFIAGIYGMNFTHIPELNWQYGYLFFWIIIIGVVLLLTVYFKRKKWL